MVFNVTRKKNEIVFNSKKWYNYMKRNFTIANIAVFRETYEKEFEDLNLLYEWNIITLEEYNNKIKTLKKKINGLKGELRQAKIGLTTKKTVIEPNIVKSVCLECQMEVEKDAIFCYNCGCKT